VTCKIQKIIVELFRETFFPTLHIRWVNKFWSVKSTYNRYYCQKRVRISGHAKNSAQSKSNMINRTRFLFMKRKHKQWWSSTPPISTKRTITSHPQALTYFTHFDITHFFYPYYDIKVWIEKMGYIKMCKIRQNEVILRREG